MYSNICVFVLNAIGTGSIRPIAVEITSFIIQVRCSFIMQNSFRKAEELCHLMRPFCAHDNGTINKSVPISKENESSKVYSYIYI